MKTETYTLYTYWASALVNGDYSGLEDAEVDQVNNFVDEMVERYGKCICLDVDLESEGFGYPDSGWLMGSVAEYTFDVS